MKQEEEQFWNLKVDFSSPHKIPPTNQKVFTIEIEFSSFDK